TVDSLVNATSFFHLIFHASLSVAASAHHQMVAGCLLVNSGVVCSGAFFRPLPFPVFCLIFLNRLRRASLNCSSFVLCCCRPNSASVSSSALNLTSDCAVMTSSSVSNPLSMLVIVVSLNRSVAYNDEVPNA